MPLWTWLLIIIALAAAAFFAGMAVARRHSVRKVNYMLDSIEDGELNFRFRDKGVLNRSLNRLRRIYERQRINNEQESWSRLIRVLTHEIMNTLTPVVALSDAMRNRDTNDSDRNIDISEGLELISESSKNLMEFVGKYRQITGLSKPLRSKVDLNVLIDRIVRLNGETLSAGGVECTLITGEDSIVLYADEVQIGQVIQNLLKNAVQANARKIEIKTRRLEDDTIVVSISNDGTQISAEQSGMIFIPFYTTKKDGTGIGLSVCRQIMKNHQGSIDLLRSTPKETIFELTFH